jgi:serine/threonine-protein kinase RsbT
LTTRERRPDLPGPPARGEIRIPVREEPDVAIARQTARAAARALGFPTSGVEAIATAVSEVARNIAVHSRGGEVVVRVAVDGARRGIEIVARDDAPGIADVERAMQDGYSTAGSLGLGLPAARRLMDAFALESEVGAGTTVTMKKWLHGTHE